MQWQRRAHKWLNSLRPISSFTLFHKAVNENFPFSMGCRWTPRRTRHFLPQRIINAFWSHNSSVVKKDKIVAWNMRFVAIHIRVLCMQMAQFMCSFCSVHTFIYCLARRLGHHSRISSNMNDFNKKKTIITLHTHRKTHNELCLKYSAAKSHERVTYAQFVLRLRVPVLSFVRLIT